MGAVGELAGQVDAAGRRALAHHLLLRGAAGLARPRGEDDAGDDRLGDRLVVVEPVLGAGRTMPSTADSTSGLFSRSLVCPWNCGSATNTDRMPVVPSRMSSAVSVTPFGDRLCVSM